MGDIFKYEGMMHTKHSYTHRRIPNSMINLRQNTLSPDSFVTDEGLNNHKNTSDTTFPSSSSSNFNNNSTLSNLPFYKRFYYNFMLFGLPYVQKCFAVILTLLTIIIIWSEFTLSFMPQLSIFALVTKYSTLSSIKYCS